MFKKETSVKEKSIGVVVVDKFRGCCVDDLEGKRKRF